MRANIPNIDYSVSIQKTIPSSPMQAYICGLNVEFSPLVYGGCIGIGDTIEDSIADWKERMQRFLVRNELAEWPEAIQYSNKMNVVETFIWNPKLTKLYKELTNIIS